MIKARRLGHIVLSVRDLKASVDFYTRTIGLEVVQEKTGPDRAFLSLGDDHHQIAFFQEAAPDAAPLEDSQPGIQHIAWQVEDFDALQAAWRELKEIGIPVERTVEHNVTRSLYFRDPDNNCVELYCNRWEKGFEAMQTTRMSTAPLDIETGKTGEVYYFDSDEAPPHFRAREKTQTEGTGS